MDTGFPTVVWCLCLGLGFAVTPPIVAGVSGACAWVQVLVSPHPSRLGFVVCAVGLGFWRAPRHSWLGFWGVCGCVRAPPVPRHSWHGCAVWVFVLGLGFRQRPATPGWGVGVCVCLCARSASTRPLLAGVCGVGVCAWALVLAAPRHSWLGCCCVCVFVCALRLYPATPGWGVRWCGCVCMGSGFGSAPPLLAGVLGCMCVCVRAPLVPRHCWLGCAVWVCVLGLGFWRAPRHSWLGCWGVCVCVCVRAPLVPRHSWLGCAVWVCVLGLGFRPRPATPGWGVGVCVCLRARSACTPPLLAGVCGVAVCAWARVSAAPRHSWLGCWGVCVFVCALRLYPATPGWGVRRRCVCLGSGFGCAPPLLVGVLGFVCVCARAPLVPRHSWLGCAVWVCVLGLGFRLRPATPGWGVGVCVCLCACSACTRPLLAGACGVGVCAWAGVSAAPRDSCWGVGVCVSVCSLCLYPAIPGWGLWCVGWVLPGTCSCAVVRCGLCALPGVAAPGGRCCLAPVRVPWLWPAACLTGVPRGPALVRRASSGPVALGAPVGFFDAVVSFPTPGACAPGFTGRLRGARAGRPRTGLFLPAAGRCPGSRAALARRRTRSGPRDGVVPSAFLRRRSWAACASVVCMCGPGH